MGSTSGAASRRSRSSAAVASQRVVDSQPWTATRCQRLLRPLQSRIATIRRELATLGQISATPAKSGTSLPKHQTLSPQQWLKPRKKRVRTYSQRHIHGDGQLPGDGSQQAPVLTHKAFCQDQGRSDDQRQMCPATPLLRKAANQLFSSPVAPPLETIEGITGAHQEQPRRRGKRKQTEISERLSSCRSKCDARRYADLEAIYRAFEALLVATAPHTAPQQANNGFLGVCLRRVPDYIAGVEAWEQDEAEASGTGSTVTGINTSAQIYNDLEALGAHNGWKYLRAVVMADGVRALALAIEDGLWIDNFTQALVALCMRFGASKEAERLLNSLSYRLLLSEEAITDSIAAGRHDRLPHGLLLNFAAETGRRAYVLEQYRHLLVHDGFSMDWLLTDGFNDLWELAINTLSKDSSARQAVDFATDLVVVVGQRLPRITATRHGKSSSTIIATLQHKALIGALAAMASMSFLGEHGANASTTPDNRTIRVGNRLRYILRSCIHNFRQRRKHISHMGYSLACLALLCSSASLHDDSMESGLTQSLNGLWSERTAPCAGWIPRWREHFDILVSLISSISINCSRATASTPQYFLDIFFRRLQQLELEAGVVDALKAASAFHLAQQTNNVRDLIYAENLQKRALTDGGVNETQGSAITPVKASSQILFTGYAWDETIGEWVMATPATTSLAIRTPRQPRLELDSEDSDDDLSLGMMETPQLQSSLPVTPYTMYSEGEARRSASPRNKRQMCSKPGPRRSLPVVSSTSRSTTHRISQSETEDSDADEVAASCFDDELAQADESDNGIVNTRLTTMRRHTAKRRRTHSDLFTTARSGSRIRSSAAPRTISSSFIGVSSSDDELGL